jgi:arylformamidase
VADSPEWLARWRERSAIVRASPGARVDIIYGARSRARLDYFPCGKKQAPLFVFIHGGYWQRNEKETFAFVADGPRAHGIDVAVPGYTLAPQARLTDIVEEIHEPSPGCHRVPTTSDLTARRYSSAAGPPGGI